MKRIGWMALGLVLGILVSTGYRMATKEVAAPRQVPRRWRKNNRVQSRNSLLCPRVGKIHRARLLPVMRNPLPRIWTD